MLLLNGQRKMSDSNACTYPSLLSFKNPILFQKRYGGNLRLEAIGEVLNSVALPQDSLKPVEIRIVTFLIKCE